MLLEQDNAALNTALEPASRICYVKRWSQYCHTGVAGSERSPHAYSSVKLPKIPTHAAGTKSSLESLLSPRSHRSPAAPEHIGVGKGTAFLLLLRRRSRGKGDLVLHACAFACAEQEARKGAAGMNKNLETDFFLVANRPLSGFRVRGCVGRKQRHWERLSSTSNYGLNDQDLSLEHGFQI